MNAKKGKAIEEPRDTEFSIEKEKLEKVILKLLNGTKEERLKFWASTGIYTAEGDLTSSYL